MLLESLDISPFEGVLDMADYITDMNEHALKSDNVQKFIHSTGLHFDVVINEEFYADSFLMFAHKFKAPIITVCEYCANNIMQKMIMNFLV